MAGGSDRAPLLATLGSRRSTVRQEAIAGALKEPDADDLLAEMFEITTDRHDRLVIAAGLGALDGDAGTATFRNAVHRTGPGSRDLRCAAVLGLAKRCGDAATPWLRDALEDRDSAVKEYAVIGLTGTGNGDAWDEVEARLRTLLGRTFDTCEPSPVLYAVAHLGQHVRDDGGRRRLVSLLRRHWSNRTLDEAQWFKTYWPTATPDGPGVDEVGARDARALRTWARSPLFDPLVPPLGCEPTTVHQRLVARKPSGLGRDETPTQRAVRPGNRARSRGVILSACVGKPSVRPPTGHDPDENDAWRFGPLAARDPEGATRLIDHFAPRWLAVAGLPMTRRAEVPDTVELVVADSWDPANETYVLRLTSWYTGETRWLGDWDGRAETALLWIEETADALGRWVRTERTKYDPTPWDE